MGLMDAKEYDPRPAQRRWRMIGILAVVVVIYLVLWYWPIVPWFYRNGNDLQHEFIGFPWVYRYWPEERVVKNFFQAIEQKDFETAYAVYNADPDWKQHPEKYQYTLNQFKLDWGPSSEYGAITTHKIDCTTEPEKKGFHSSSGVIVVVIINGRSQVMLNDHNGPVSMWVEKKSKTLTLSPYPVQCHPPR